MTHGKQELYFTRQLRVVGNSLSVGIPPPIRADLGLVPGSEVRVYVVGRVICVQPTYAAGFTPGVIAVRQHAEVDNVG